MTGTWKNPDPSWHTVEHPYSRPLPVRFRPGPTPDAPLVVLCHGMGETPDPFAARWPRVTALPVHLIAPAGPHPFEIRDADGIRIGHAWYLYDGEREPFRDTVTRSAEWLVNVIESLETREGWTPVSRTLLGYSQGAYFGYVAALNHQDHFDRLVAVAGRLKKEFTAGALATPGTLRTLVVHGEQDRAVSPDAARDSHRVLVRAGYSADLFLHPGGHGLTDDLDDHAATWLTAGD